MNTLGIRTKLLLLLAVPVISLILLCFVSINTFSRINSGMQGLYNDRIVPLEQLKTIADAYAVNIIDAVNKADKSLISPAEALSSISTAESTIQQKLSSYLQTHLTLDEQALITKLKVSLTAADPELSKVKAALQKMGSSNNGELAQINGQLYRVIDPISEKVSELITLQLHVAELERNTAEQLYSSSRNIFIATALLVTLSIAIVGYLTANGIAAHLVDVKNALENAQKNSDLTVRVGFERADEIGQLAVAFKKMISHFRDIIEHVRKTSQELNVESQNLNAITLQTNSGMLSQQRDTDLAATASTEMTATIEEVARNAQQAAQAAEQASNQSTKASGVVAETVEQFEELATQMSLTGTKIQLLSDDSNAIGRVVDVIKSIAEQTNLLALNAAIEAARAGDQGRGFAVVADEVRSLAKRTQDSTQEIQDMIERLQRATGEAVNSTQQITHMIQRTKEQNSFTQEALSAINHAVCMISDMNMQIATATEEQSQVSQEINKNIVNIAGVSRETVAATERIDTAVRQLSHMSGTMNKMVEAFKV